MNWEKYGPDITRLADFPGGTFIADQLVDALELRDGMTILDIWPGTGIVGSVIAREFDTRVTVLAPGAREESKSEACASDLKVSERVTVIPGAPGAIPTPEEQFNRLFCVAHPFPLPASPDLIAEYYRVLAPDGLLGLAGPASINNETPYYMEDALEEQDVEIKTPAYTALQYASQGFHIQRAEYVHGAWDLWLEWLETSSSRKVPGKFRDAIVEDGGRWLSLGLIILRKPVKPVWAI